MTTAACPSGPHVQFAVERQQAKVWRIQQRLLRSAMSSSVDADVGPESSCAMRVKEPAAPGSGSPPFVAATLHRSSRQQTTPAPRGEMKQDFQSTAEKALHCRAYRAVVKG
eukprot:Selendium_serpulae@DN10250_c0_g1_i1.p2